MFVQGIDCYGNPVILAQAMVGPMGPVAPVPVVFIDQPPFVPPVYNPHYFYPPMPQEHQWNHRQVEEQELLQRAEKTVKEALQIQAYKSSICEKQERIKSLEKKIEFIDKQRRTKIQDYEKWYYQEIATISDQEVLKKMANKRNKKFRELRTRSNIDIAVCRQEIATLKSKMHHST